MNNEKIENLKSYIKDFYRCEVCFIEENVDGLIIYVTVANAENKKAFKLTCMEKAEKYEVIGAEDIDYNSTFIVPELSEEKRHKNLFTVKNIIIIKNAIDYYLEHCKKKIIETNQLIPSSCAETETKLQDSLKFYNRNVKELEELLDTIQNLDYSKIDK